MGGLDRFEAPHQEVVLSVRNLGRIEHMVEMIRAIDLLAQLIGFGAGLIELSGHEHRSFRLTIAKSSRM